MELLEAFEDSVRVTNILTKDDHPQEENEEKFSTRSQKPCKRQHQNNDELSQQKRRVENMKTIQLILASEARANLSRVKAEMILGQVEIEVSTSQAEAKVNPCQILNQSKIEVNYLMADRDMIDQPSNEVDQRG
ncbi:unnamed protein product [Citrullus colocynthis]|uniref:Uncharacterized protein n=1 Tax=Citrullus colocynthis TaxID=252529 RepID=A0ABP0YKX3_9ROSI